MKLKDKIAVITGGSSGIGHETAKRFHSEGARVLVTASSDKSAAAARVSLEGIAEVVVSDAGSADDVALLFAHIREKYGRVDVLFLNAGVTSGSVPMEQLDEAAFDRMMRTNVKGPWLAIRAAMPLMPAGSSIVINGSISGVMGMKGSSAYAASKAAVRAIGRVAAAELVERGIRVNVVSPGPTKSGIIQKNAPADVAAAIEDRLSSMIPMKRMGTNAEIANAVLFAASDDSSFMTGEELFIDGGISRF